MSAALAPFRDAASYINYTIQNDKLFFEIELNNKKFNMLFDSGASISLMKKRFAEDQQLSLQKTKSIYLRLANSDIIESNELTDIEIIFNENPMQQIFYILESLNENVLLGMDFFNSASLLITTEQDLKFNFNTEPDLEDYYKQIPIFHMDLQIAKKVNENYCFIQSKDDRQNIAIQLNQGEHGTNETNSVFDIFNMVTEDNFENFKFDMETTDPVVIQQLKELLEEYKHLFAFNMKQLRGANGVVHHIDTGDHPPIKQRSYRYGYHEQQEIERQVKEMLEAGIIRPTQSSWSNPIVLVHRDGKARLCLDYRKLNSITKPDVFPLPIIEDLVDRLSGNPIMSTLDLRNGYFQVPMAQEDCVKTAFSTNNNSYEFVFMPFGLQAAVSSFQRLMNDTFRDLLNKNLSVYIDDIVVYSATVEDHFKHLTQVFERLDSRNLRLHPQKCRFFCSEIKYLGFIINKEGIKPDPRRTEAIQNFPRPQKVKDIRSFIGSCNFYRKYIKDFATIARPLTNLIRKDVKFNFTEECQEAFDRLKTILSSEPILSHYRVGDQLILYTDASGFGLGAILNQEQDGHERTLQYASATLNKHQENYSVTQREMLGIVWACRKFRSYLYGNTFIIKVDHCSLCYLLKMKDPNGKLARWALQLQALSFKIQYTSGKEHESADFLSRYPLKEVVPEDLDDIPAFQTEDIDMKAAQEVDPWIRDVKKRLEHKKLKPNENYIIENDILYRKMFDSKGIERQLLCLPSALRKDILFTLHGDKTSGHGGFIRTLYKVKDRFYFPRVEKIVRKFVRSCPECQSRKKEPGLPKGDLQSIVAEEPFSLIGMDILGSFPEASKTKNKYVIIMIDYYTKYVESIAVKDITAETVADFFIYSIILRHGAVKRLISDQAQSFCAKFSESVYQAFKVKHIRSSAYHPETAGLVEKQCHTLTDMLALYVREDHRNWDAFLPFLVFAYNTARQETTKFSPFYLVFGRDPRLPIDVALNLPSTFKEIEDIDTRFAEARGMVKQFVAEARRKQKIVYDKKHKQIQYDIGQKVMLFTKRRVVSLSGKLMRNFFGPYVITSKIPPNTYIIEDIETKYRTRAHINRLKPYFDDNIDEESIWPTPKQLKEFDHEDEGDNNLPVGVNDETDQGMEENSMELNVNPDNVEPK